jgi:transposase
MTLQPTPPKEIPSDTVDVAKAAFPRGSTYLKLREELGVLFSDEQFAALYSERGQPAETPWRLALVTLMQFMENLTDRQAADAVRGRIDWKYLLGLSLKDAGFDFSVLSEFRTRLITGQIEGVLFETIVEICRQRGWVKAGGKQRSDATHIVAAVRRMNRVELVGEAIYHVLDVMAQVDPNWLKDQVKAGWYERYSQRMSSFRLPKGKKEQLALAEIIGQDGRDLLTQIYASSAPEYLRKLPAVEGMRQIWLQNFYQEGEQIHLRDDENSPAAQLKITSPYDEEARFSQKRDVDWNGYKAHLTETCEEDSPHLIVHVETTVATQHDNSVVEQIHAALKRKDLLPETHLVDAGYPSADLLMSSLKDYGIDLFGPVQMDRHWQTQDEQAFDLNQFQIDWENQKVTCPMGKINTCWNSDQKTPTGKPTIRVGFRKADCRVCSARARCTRSPTSARTLSLLPKESYNALQSARARQKTKEFQKIYSTRSGIEGTIGIAADKLGMRRSRYRGLAKTHFQHLITAAAINIHRMLNWIEKIPRSVTQKSHFAALAA